MTDPTRRPSPPQARIIAPKAVGPIGGGGGGGPGGLIVGAIIVGALIYGVVTRETAVEPEMSGNRPVAYLHSSYLRRFREMAESELGLFDAAYKRVYGALQFDTTGKPLGPVDSIDIWAAKMKGRAPRKAEDVDSLLSLMKQPIVVAGVTYPQYFNTEVGNRIANVGCLAGQLVVHYDPIAVLGVVPGTVRFFRAHEMGHLAHSHVGCTPDPTPLKGYSERVADCWADSVLEASGQHDAVVDARAYFHDLDADSVGFHPASRVREKYLLRHCK